MRPKKVIGSTIIVLLMLASMFLVAGAGNVVASQEGGYTYTTAGVPSEATVTAYTGPGGMITIPSTLGGYPVTAIGQNAFHSVSTLTSVIIPEGITSIGSGAFAYCSGMLSVTVPESVS